MIKVSNMRSDRSGREVANQFIIHTQCSTIFQSYSTVIAKENRKGEVTLDPMWDCSRTTMKYLSKFLGRNAKEIRECIASKRYKVKDLNK